MSDYSQMPMRHLDNIKDLRANKEEAANRPEYAWAENPTAEVEESIEYSVRTVRAAHTRIRERLQKGLKLYKEDAAYVLSVMGEEPPV